MDDFQVKKTKRPGKTSDPGEQPCIAVAFEDVVLAYAKYLGYADDTAPAFTPKGMAALLQTTLPTGASIDVATLQRAFQDTPWEADVLLFIASLSVDGDSLLSVGEAEQFAKTFGVPWAEAPDHSRFQGRLAAKEAMALLHDVDWQGDLFPDHDPVDLSDHEDPYI